MPAVADWGASGVTPVAGSVTAVKGRLAVPKPQVNPDVLASRSLWPAGQDEGGKRHNQ